MARIVRPRAAARWLVDLGRRSMTKIHVLKCAEPHFTDVAEGRKRFEIRFNDRGYAVGDILELISLGDGRRQRVEVLHMLEDYGGEGSNYGLAEGFVIMSIRQTGWET